MIQISVCLVGTEVVGGRAPRYERRAETVERFARERCFVGKPERDVAGPGQDVGVLGDVVEEVPEILGPGLDIEFPP